MIRPITCVTFLMACGSGLYLYQAKHRVHVLDQEIVDVVHQTAQVGEQERVLRAQWALLDQPDRLRDLSGQFLTLQPTKQSQYATADTLGSRLPPVEQPPAPADTAAPSAVQAVADAAAPATPASAAQAPAAPKETSVASAAREPAHSASRPADAPRAAVRTVAEQVPASRPAAPRPQLAVVHHEAPLPRPRPPAPERSYVALPAPRPMPRYEAPVVQAAAPRYGYPAAPQPVSARYGGGSLLGMARSAAPPPPAPVPVSSWQKWHR